MKLYQPDYFQVWLSCSSHQALRKETKGVLSNSVVFYKCVPCSGMAGCVTINTCSISLLYSIACGMYDGVPGGVAGLAKGCCM